MNKQASYFKKDKNLKREMYFIDIQVKEKKEEILVFISRIKKGW